MWTRRTDNSDSIGTIGRMGIIIVRCAREKQSLDLTDDEQGDKET